MFFRLILHLRLLSLGNIDISDQAALCGGGLSQALKGVWQHPGLCPAIPVAHTFPPSCDNQNCPLEGKLPLVVNHYAF